MEDSQAEEAKYEKSIGTRAGKVLAEVLGTATLMFIGCMPQVLHDPLASVTIMAPIAFGLAVAAAIQMYGHISGGHFNPAVTIAALILGKMEYILGPFYLLAQFVGAFLGYGALILVSNKDLSDGCCVTTINPQIELYQGLIIEFLATGFLTSLCCAVWDKRHAKNTDSVSIRFGLCLTAVFLAAANWTGASINPARSFAPAVLQNIWKDHWVYWVGPILGGIVPAVFYRFIYMEGLAKVQTKKEKERTSA